MWILGFIFAELIPVSIPRIFTAPSYCVVADRRLPPPVQFFNQLLTIISSLVSTWSAYGVPGIVWFFMRKPEVREQGWRKTYFGSWLSTFFFFCSSISVSLQWSRFQFELR